MAFGAPAEVVSEATRVETDFEVWEENADVVDLFLKLQTQWTVSTAGVVGLNYASVDFCLKNIQGQENGWKFSKGCGSWKWLRWRY